MKIQHVTAYPADGAGIACRRIHQAVQKAGIESTIIYRPQRVPFFWRCLYFLMFLLQKLQRSTNPIYHTQEMVPGLISVDELNHSDNDIIHLHWINNNTLGIADIAKLRKPVVWTMHDSWPVCGAEHHPDVLHGDRRYQTGYTAANRPLTSRGPDWDKWVWRRKKHCWRELNVHFVAPSHWECGVLRDSALFGHLSCQKISYPLDQNIFQPLDQKHCRERLGIALDKKVILFGAQSVSDPNKGMYLLLQALQIISKSGSPGQYHLVTFGGNGNLPNPLPIAHTNVGKIREETALAELYNAADVFVCPSIIDNFPNTCMEALSCGTPVAAFAAGGLPDMIRQKQNGFLAAPYDPDQLAQGILYCLAHHDALSANAVKFAGADFDEAKIAAQYIKLYRQILEGVTDQ